jgi:large subunit ribosomal protein L18
MGLTSYRVKKKAVLSHGVLLAVRVSGKNVTAAFIKPRVEGDKTLYSVHSHTLRKLGWKGSLKSIPACYLLGLLAGKGVLGKGVKEAYLYCGIVPFVKGSRFSAFAKGVIDSGVRVSLSDEVLPDEERLNGGSIAKFALKLLREDKEEYIRRFASLLKSGFKPEEYTAHFEQIKTVIMGGKR